MTRPLSLDLRRRVIAAIKWRRLWLETGSVAPRTQGGDRRRGRIEALGAAILAMAEEGKDITLVEIAERLEREPGERFAPSTVHRFFRRHGRTFRKSPATPPSRSARTSPRRATPGPGRGLRWKVRDQGLKSIEAVVQRQERVPSEGNDHRLLSLGQDGGPRFRGPGPDVLDRRALARDVSSKVVLMHKGQIHMELPPAKAFGVGKTKNSSNSSPIQGIRQMPRRGRQVTTNIKIGRKRSRISQDGLVRAGAERQTGRLPYRRRLS